MMFLTPREALGDDIPGGWDNSGCESDEETLSAILCEWWESNKAACISDLRIEGLEIVAIDGDGGRHTMSTPCSEDDFYAWVEELPTCGRLDEEWDEDEDSDWDTEIDSDDEIDMDDEIENNTT